GHRERHAPRLSPDPPLAHGLSARIEDRRRTGGGLRVRSVGLRLQAAPGARAVAASDHPGRRPPPGVGLGLGGSRPRRGARARRTSRARPAGALEIGRRVFLCAPTARHREELLTLINASQRVLRPWVAPPASRAAFTAYLRRSRRATERAFLVCRL